MGISSVLNDAEVFKELVASVFHLVFPFDLENFVPKSVCLVLE